MPHYGLRLAAPFGFVQHGAVAEWDTTAPAGVTISGVYTINDRSVGVNDGHGYYGEFFWDGGKDSTAINDSFDVSGFSTSFATQHFGWYIYCAYQQGCNYPAETDIGQLYLTANETASPSIYPFGSLWTDNGWVRGTMPIGFGASDPSGICSSQVLLGTLKVPGPGGTPQQNVWHQCPNQIWSTTLDTRTAYGSSGLGEGKMPLVITATDAAGNGNWAPKTVYVDNETPTVDLSGPSSALVTDGTQYISATASAGPSGISGISCSVDGGPDQWHPGSTARLPVSGVGRHSATCAAYNSARDASGNVAASQPASFSMTIRQPTAAGIWFPSVANAPVCRSVHVRVRIPGRWVTIHRHHRPIWIHTKARTVVRRSVKCSLRTIRRRVVTWTTVKRRGRAVRIRHVRYVKVVLPPQAVNVRTERVGFGKPTTVAGWVGTTSLSALGGQTVAILAAPADGQGAFRTVATATTNSAGLWAAQLPPGPSELVEALYPGAGSMAPTASNQIATSVPARVLLSIHPRRTHWGGRIRITGQVVGGYIPAGGELVVLRIGWHGGSTEIGHLYTDASGRFAAPYRFLRGNGTERYSIWAASARESAYPYAPASSARVRVTVRER